MRSIVKKCTDMRNSATLTIHNCTEIVENKHLIPKHYPTTTNNPLTEVPPVCFWFSAQSCIYIMVLV